MDLSWVGNRKSIPIPESDTCCQIKISIPPINSYALFFFFICEDRTYSDQPGPCSLGSAPKFSYSCDQKPKKLSIIFVIAKRVAREVSPPT